MSKFLFSHFSLRSNYILPLVALFLLAGVRVCYAAGDSYENKEARMKTACAMVNTVDFPRQDPPSDADKKALQNCESRNFYYGIGVPIDYVKARQCAFVEKDKSNDGSTFSGPTILMMLYANGQGVKRDLDLAIKLACNINGAAPYENTGRVNHLLDMKEKPNQPFDFCDDVGSDTMTSACERLSNDIDQTKRDEKLHALTAHWSEKDQAAFMVLSKVANSFFDSHANNEIDQQGAISSTLVASEKGPSQKDFLSAIENFEKGKFPTFSISDDQQAEIKLNTLYAKTMKNFKVQFADTTLTKADVEKAQRAWLAYRNAWLKFAAIHYPQLSAASLRTWLTKQRIEQLNSLGKE
jgi:hypothetical protein